MKSFRKHIDEMSVRNVNDDNGHLEELKFDKVHVALTQTEKGLTFNTTGNVFNMNKKEINELISALKHFV